MSKYTLCSIKQCLVSVDLLWSCRHRSLFEPIPIGYRNDTYIHFHLPTQNHRSRQYKRSYSGILNGVFNEKLKGIITLFRKLSMENFVCGVDERSTNLRKSYRILFIESLATLNHNNHQFYPTSWVLSAFIDWVSFIKALLMLVVIAHRYC